MPYPRPRYLRELIALEGLIPPAYTRCVGSKKVQKIAIAALVLGSAGLICVAQKPGVPGGWVATDRPAGSAADGDHMQCATYSENEWQVSMRSSELHIVDTGSEKRADDPLPPRFVRTKEMPGRAVAVRVGDGWLIGFDSGEFGGGLWWADAEGRQTKQLSGENVRVIVKRGEEALVLTGLAHMSSDHGGVSSYRPAAGGGGDLVRIADLGSSPAAAMFRSDGTLLIAAQARVLELTSENKLNVVFQDDNMSLLYPNSIVEGKDGSLFVGMRFYVLQLSRTDDGPFQPAWFVRSKCTKTKISDFRCVCVGK